MAKQYAYSKSSHELFTPTKDPANPSVDRPPHEFFEEWSEADPQNLPLLCAELSRLSYGGQRLVEQALPRAGMKLIENGWVGGKTPEEEIALSGTEFFVATAMDETTYVVFRGTESKLIDVVTDLKARQVHWKEAEGVLVHVGFKTAYDLIRPRLSQLLAGRKGKVVFTGHSLGGALATLGAADFADTTHALVTFGSPRIGNAAFAGLFKDVRIHRYVQCTDVVTRVPPEKLTAAHAGELLDPLLGSGCLSGLRNWWISLLAGSLFGNIEFKHVGNPTYIDWNGGIHQDPSADFISRDQASARAAYGVFGMRFFRLGKFSNTLKNLIFGKNTDVPFRDLADHTPLNYLSAFTGRRSLPPGV